PGPAGAGGRRLRVLPRHLRRLRPPRHLTTSPASPGSQAAPRPATRERENRATPFLVLHPPGSARRLHGCLLRPPSVATASPPRRPLARAKPPGPDPPGTFEEEKLMRTRAPSLAAAACLAALLAAGPALAQQTRVQTREQTRVAASTTTVHRVSMVLNARVVL